MRRRMSVILIIIVICSLMLTVQHSILAQVKPKQESQLRMQKAKDTTPRKGEQTESKIKTKDDIKKTQISGAELYRAIVKNNLFMPLGSGGEAKREEFALIGTMGGAAFIQIKGSDRSFYVVEGQSFGNGAKLVQVRENSATIIHEGSEKELKLASGTLVSQGRGGRGGRTGQRQGNSGKSSKKMETANRSGKERGSGSGKQGGDDGQWARKMSMDELRGTRGKIAEYIEGLRAKGVTDPAEYEGAMKKMEIVDDAMDERGYSK